MTFRLFRSGKTPAHARDDSPSCYDNVYSLELPPEKLKKLKLAWLMLSVGYTAVFAAINIVPTALCLDRMVGLLCIFTLVPMVEYWYGLIRVLLNRKEELRFTLYKVTYRRFERSARGVLCMLGLTAVRVIVLLRADSSQLTASALYWAGLAVCMALAGAALRLLARYPAKVVRQQPNAPSNAVTLEE